MCALTVTEPDTAHVAVVVPLHTVDGFVAYDVPAATASGGGTRLAPDVSAREVLVLARAMTYKLAALGVRVGGAKIGLRAKPPERASVLARFRTEIAPLLASGRLMTGPDLGTEQADFEGLPVPGGSGGIATRSIEGVPAEEFLTGYAAGVAIDAALAPVVGGLEGRTVALEGFGKVGAGVAREVARRGGRIVAVSTIEGCAVAAAGGDFPVSQLLEARNVAGDALVHRLGVEAGPPDALWRVTADVVVPGARPGVIDRRRASALRARTVVPFANAPYTAAALRVLAARGIPAHADFVVGSGGAMAYLSPEIAGARSTSAALAALDRQMTATVRRAMDAGESPFAGAVRMARQFLLSWLPAGAPLPRAPLAG